jgi:hypothetical protein
VTDSELLKAMARQLDRVEYNQVELHKAMLVMLEQMADTDEPDDSQMDLDGNLGARERDDTQPL